MKLFHSSEILILSMSMKAVEMERFQAFSFTPFRDFSTFPRHFQTPEHIFYVHIWWKKKKKTRNANVSRFTQQKLCGNYLEIVQKLCKNYVEIIQKLCRNYAKHSTKIREIQMNTRVANASLHRTIFENVASVGAENERTVVWHSEENVMRSCQLHCLN